MAHKTKQEIASKCWERDTWKKMVDLKNGGRENFDGKTKLSSRF